MQNRGTFALCYLIDYLTLPYLYFTLPYLTDEDHWLNQPNPILGFFFYGFLAFLALFPYKFFVSIMVR